MTDFSWDEPTKQQSVTPPAPSQTPVPEKQKQSQLRVHSQAGTDRFTVDGVTYGKVHWHVVTAEVLARVKAAASASGVDIEVKED